MALSSLGSLDHAICYSIAPGTHGFRARLNDCLPGACLSPVRSPEGAVADSAFTPGTIMPRTVTRKPHSSRTGSRTRDHIPSPFASPEGEGFPPSPEGTLRRQSPNPRAWSNPRSYRILALRRALVGPRSRIGPSIIPPSAGDNGSSEACDAGKRGHLRGHGRRDGWEP